MGTTMQPAVIEEIDGVYFGPSKIAQELARAFQNIMQQPVQLNHGLPVFSAVETPTVPKPQPAGHAYYKPGTP